MHSKPVGSSGHTPNIPDRLPREEFSASVVVSSMRPLINTNAQKSQDCIDSDKYGKSVLGRLNVTPRRGGGKPDSATPAINKSARIFHDFEKHAPLSTAVHKHKGMKARGA